MLPPGLPPKVMATYSNFVQMTKDNNLTEKKAILARGDSMTQENWRRLGTIINTEKQNRRPWKC